MEYMRYLSQQAIAERSDSNNAELLRFAGMIGERTGGRTRRCGPGGSAIAAAAALRGSRAQTAARRAGGARPWRALCQRHQQQHQNAHTGASRTPMTIAAASRKPRKVASIA